MCSKINIAGNPHAFGMKRGIMELKYMEIFCTVVELKSFSKAAQALHLTQPTISVHIKALEDEYSTRLLDRLGRTILPTQDGEILYRYAKEIVTLKENARRAMERITGTVSGKLIIGASTIPGEYVLPSLLAKFKKTYPDVFPTLRIGDSSDIYESVLRGDVDLGVIGTAVKDKNIITQKYLGDEIILAAPSGYKASVLQKDEFKTIPLLVREKGSGSRSSIEEHLGRIGVTLDSLRIIAEIGSSQALIQAVKSGMGLAFTSLLSVQDEIERGTLKAIKFKGISIHRNFYIITHRLRYNSLICRSFIEFLSQPRRNPSSQ
jgi:DNA-binding transcriptional LysR family regulator